MITLIIFSDNAYRRSEYKFADHDEALQAVIRMQGVMPDGLAVFKYEGGTKTGAVAVSRIVNIVTKIAVEGQDPA